MKESFYIVRDGDLKRKDNNIEVKSHDGKKGIIKSEVVDEIFLFGETTLNTKLLNFASQKGISIHVFNYYGYYSGSYIPRETNVSGFLLVEQVKYYLDEEKRLQIAKEIIKSASSNIYRNLRYYNGRGIDLAESMSSINHIINKLDGANSIKSLMGYEGNIRKTYYSQWNKILGGKHEFEKRVRRPPDNIVNTLISFINNLLYTSILSEIYKTQLNPTISFLHEPGIKRFSLALDISEIFKPLIVERMIFSLLNKNQITEDDFTFQSNYLELKESGIRKILEEYEKRMSRIISHRELGREVSYRYLIRLECYKIINQIVEDTTYEGFKIWW